MHPHPRATGSLPGRRRVLFALLLTCFAPATAAVSAAPLRSPCPATLRFAVLDLDETTRRAEGIGMTALQTAVARQVCDGIGARARIDAYPYRRALREFREGTAQGVLVAELAGRSTLPAAKRVPIMRLPFVRFGLADASRGVAAADVGMLNGMVPPAGAIGPGETVQYVTNYNAAMRQLIGGRVAELVGIRPTIDVYLSEHPQVRDRLGPMRLVGEETMTLHLRPDLPAACRDALAASAQRVAREEVAGILARTAPGVPPASFLLVGKAPATR